MVEAAHAGVPLVVVTADRPARLRGTGANQTTDQVGLFGAFAPTLDVAGADLDGLLAFLRTHDHRQPVHLNVQLDDPLLPDDDGWDGGGEAPTWAVPAVAHERDVAELAPGPRTVVVAGDDAGPPARQLAESANWPLLAEPSSGCRTGDTVIRTYRLLLDGDLGRGSSGWWSSATRRCRARCRGCSLATTSRSSRCATAGAGPSGPSPWRRSTTT